MTNYYIEKDNKIIFVDTDLQRLQNTIALGEYSELEIKETERPIENFAFSDTPEYIAEQEAKVKEIQKQLLLVQIDEIDKKRVRAICEPSLKDENKTWLEFYNEQVQELRQQIVEL